MRSRVNLYKDGDHVDDEDEEGVRLEELRRTRWMGTRSRRPRRTGAGKGGGAGVRKVGSMSFDVSCVSGAGCVASCLPRPVRAVADFLLLCPPSCMWWGVRGQPEDVDCLAGDGNSSR